MKFRPFSKYFELKNAAKVLSSFVIYPEPYLPKEIEEEINKSCRTCWDIERIERFELYGYNDKETYIFSTEVLEEKGIITGRDINNIYCGNTISEAEEKVKNILTPLKSTGLTTVEHHVHVDDSIPSLEDILFSRRLECLDIAIVSRPKKGRVYFNVKELRKIEEDEIIKAYEIAINSLIRANTFPFFGYVKIKICRKV